MKFLLMMILLLPIRSTFGLNFLTAKVKKVSQNLELLVDLDGKERSVQLLGTTLPKGKCRSSARQFLMEKIIGEEVQLEFDQSFNKIDEKGRLLTHVWHKKKLINVELIKGSLVKANVSLGNFSKESEYFQAQYNAKIKKRGIWSTKGCHSVSKKKSRSKRKKLCGKDRFNCSDFSEHSEAQRVYDYCGGIGHDIHKIDGDQNGLACESLLSL